MLVTILKFNNSDAPGLNILLRQHFRQRKTKKNDLIYLIKAQTKNSHAGAVKIDFIRYAIQLMDWDNFCGGFKIIGDAMKAAKIIKDDNPNVVINFIPAQYKVSKKDEEMVIVMVTDVLTN